MDSHKHDIKQNDDDFKKLHVDNGFHELNHVAKKLKHSIWISDSEIRHEFSHHEPGIARINNGSFGSCPASILAAQEKWQLQYLAQPDDFYFNQLKKGIYESRTLIKDLVKAKHIEEISIVDNATTAVAIALQQISWGFSEGKFQKGDAVVMFQYAYGAVKKSLQAYVFRAGGYVIEAQLHFPVRSNQEIINEFRKALDKGKCSGRKVRLAVIDHITSMPSVVIPVKELVKICREEGVDQVFVDGAHSIGNIEVNVEDIGADFYTSNLHKWLFCPPSAAFLYCRKSPIFPSDVHHPVVSSEYGNGLAIESGWIGTRDYSSQLVITSLLDFVNRFEGGIDGIRKRNHEAVVKMGQMLAKAWGTNLGSPPDMCSSMVMVGLPASLGVSSETDALNLRTHLRDKFGVEVPIYYHATKDGAVEKQFEDDCIITGYARISYQVYNKVDDYERFRDAVNQMVQDGFTCKMLLAS